MGFAALNQSYGDYGAAVAAGQCVQGLRRP
jgi:hypothetical protein